MSRKKHFMRIIAVLAMLGCIAASAYAIHETIPSETQVALPGADAGKLYEYITRHNPYTGWRMWPGKGKLYKGTEPHGALLTTYVNETVFGSINKKKGILAGDSIIVKENYTPKAKLDAVTVMYKIKGYNPAAGDWFWAKYDPKGTVLASGRVEACINCHGKNKDNDYIMTGKVK